MKIEPIIIISLSIAILFIAIPVLANDGPEELPMELSMPGRIEGTGTYFEIKDSEHLNITLKSSEEIKVILESIPEMISLDIELVSDSIVSAILTIEGFEPNTTYYKFKDSYKNKAVFVSDGNGSYSWTQDISQPHYIWFQPEDNGTVFLPEHCSTYGIWDEITSTCILTQDLTESVEIIENDITLDCNGYSITGAGAAYGIYLSNKNNITIKDCIIRSFCNGIRIYYSSRNTISNNDISNNWVNGVYLRYSISNTITNNNILNSPYCGIVLDHSSNSNTISDNIISTSTSGIRFYAYCNNNIILNNTVSNNYKYGGILITAHSDNNTISNNTISNNNKYGIHFFMSNNNAISNNTISDNEYCGIDLYFSNSNRIYHNNFVNNFRQVLVESGYGNLFDNGYPADFDPSIHGGNYWSDYTGADLYRGPNQDQLGSDEIGDTPYTFTGGEDRYPFMEEDGWVGLVFCGNGICEFGETFENCYQDCIEEGIEKYFPYYYFSLDEEYYPTSFYFDNDANVKNNRENYDTQIGIWDKPYIYVHSIEDENFFTIQYWLYYVYNPKLPKLGIFGSLFDHEHDWEVIYVVFDKTDFAAPIELNYAHHLWTDGISWDQTEKIDSHPKIYVAKNSHASYPNTAFVTWPDNWEENAKLSFPDFNEYLAKNCVTEIEQNGIIFCLLEKEVIKGDSQPEPKEGYWPKRFSGEGRDCDAPWYRPQWGQTKPAEATDYLVLGLRFPTDTYVAELHIYDPLGRHVGINHVTGEYEAQIPEIEYSLENDGQFFTIPNPIRGDYEIQIIGSKIGDYHFGAYGTVDEVIAYLVGALDQSTAKDVVHTFTATPSLVSVEKIFKPDEIHVKRSGAIQPRITLTNIGLFNISKLEIVDDLLPQWMVKNKNSLSFSMFINNKEYGLQFKAVDITVENGKVKALIDFSKGIEITDEDGNEQIIYMFEPDWILTMKYPSRPPKKIELGTYTTEVDVDAISIPIKGFPEGVSVTVSAETALKIKE